MISNLIKVECTGSNINKFISNCVINNIELIDIKKEEKNITFYVVDSNYKLLVKNIPNGCVVKKLSNSFWTSIKKICIQRVGILIGIIISLIGLFMVNNTLLNIKIIGDYSVDDDEIIKILGENGILKYRKMSFGNSYVESVLSNNFTFSLVSVIRKGNTLIISLKEEIPDILDNIAPIYSDYNMIIESIDVYSGTPMVSSGDIVYAGDILVDNYILNGETKMQVKPSAQIKGKVFFSDNYVFRNTDIIKQRTGRYIITENKLSLGNISILNTYKNNNFSDYEIEKSENLVSNYFLPIKTEKTVFYELCDVEIKRNFDEEKDNIIESVKNGAYSKVPSHLAVENEDLQISQTNFGYIVTIYLKSSVYLRYN